MSLCVNCIYHQNTNQDVTQRIRGKCITIHLTHICTHPDHKTVDFVTGEERFDSCYKWNGFQECRKFDDGTVIEPEDPIEPDDPVIDDPTGDDTNDDEQNTTPPGGDDNITEP